MYSTARMSRLDMPTANSTATARRCSVSCVSTELDPQLQLQHDSLMHPVLMVLAAFLGFMLGFFSHPAWFVVSAAFLAAYAVHLVRWLFWK